MKFDDKDDQAHWKLLLKLLCEVDDPKVMEKILDFFLTPNEQEYLVHRMSITKALLTTDLPQREIAEKMGVSIAKITAGSNQLKRTDTKTKQYLKDFLSK